MNRVRTPLRSIADTLCKSKSREHGRRNVIGRLGICRTLANMNGRVFLGYGEESITKSLQIQIVNALRSGERSRASSLLVDLGNGHQSLNAADFVYILNYCARSPDPLFVMETWRLMEEKEIGLNNKSCLLMVRALCKGGYLDEACNLIKLLGENRGIYPHLAVYNCFLGACAKMQSVIPANQCLDLMERRKVGKNEITYSVLLELAVWWQNLSAVHEIWKDYTKNYSLNIIFLQKFIWSFTRLKDLKSACETLQHMVALAVSGKLFVSRTHQGRYSSRLDIPIPSKGELGSQQVKLGENELSLDLKFGTDASNIEKWQSVSATVGMLNNYKSLPVMKVLRWSFSDVLLACAQAGDYGLAEELMVLDLPERAVRILTKMRQIKLQPDIKTYELLFSLFGNVNAPYEEGNILSQVDSIKRINAIEMDMAKNGVQHSHLSMKKLLKALGAEGMTRELLQYLHVAENLFCHTNTYLGVPIYNIVLHSLVRANESHMAIQIFKNMKSCGFQLTAATYSIMIDYCSTIRCFKSACALVSMMIRDGFYPDTLTYTALIKILLDCENFDEALNLLDRPSLEGYQLDVLLYNTILKKASEKGRIDIIEFIVERMQQDKVRPDPSTCHLVFSTYVDRGFHNTAMEALQVLSMWMISDEDSTLEEKKREFEDDFVLSEGLEAESRILRVFKDHDEHLAAALLNLRWCAILGFPISWSPNQSQWARRLTTNYDSTRAVLWA